MTGPIRQLPPENRDWLDQPGLQAVFDAVGRGSAARRRMELERKQGGIGSEQEARRTWVLYLTMCWREGGAAGGPQAWGPQVLLSSLRRAGMARMAKPRCAPRIVALAVPKRACRDDELALCTCAIVYVVVLLVTGWTQAWCPPARRGSRHERLELGRRSGDAAPPLHTERCL